MKGVRRGQVWDLDGTTILVLGRGSKARHVRCLVLHDDDENLDGGDVTEWTTAWFDKLHFATRLA